MAQSVKTILDELLANHNNWQLQLLNQWPSIVGSIKTRVHLLKIDTDTLTIGVQDSCWLQELYLLSPLLIGTINQKLDHPRIKHLRFKALGTPITKNEQKNKKTVRILPKVTLNSKEQETLAQIKDEQLRNALKNYLIRCHQENS
ncbi:MAG: hypothetical protein AMXMBFR12_06370 [Candidatus Babeliales bacterium]